MLQLLFPLRSAWLLLVISLLQDGISERPTKEDAAQAQHMHLSRAARSEQRVLALDDMHAHNERHEENLVTAHNATTKGKAPATWKAPPTWHEHPIVGSQHWKNTGWFTGKDRASICYENHAYPCGEGEDRCCCRLGCKHTGLSKLSNGEVDTCDCAGGGAQNPNVKTYMIPRSQNKDKDFHFCKKKDGVKHHAHECGGDEEPGCCCNGGFDYSLDLNKCVPSNDPHFKKTREEEEAQHAEAAAAKQATAAKEQERQTATAMQKGDASWLQVSFGLSALISTMLFEL